MKVFVLSLVSRPLEALVVFTLIAAVVCGTVFVFQGGAEPATQPATLDRRIPQSIELNEDDILSLRIERKSNPIVFQPPTGQFVVIEKAATKTPPENLIAHQTKTPSPNNEQPNNEQPNNEQPSEPSLVMPRNDEVAQGSLSESKDKVASDKPVMKINGVDFQIPIQNRTRNEIQTVEIARQPKASGIGLTIDGVKLAKLSEPIRPPVDQDFEPQASTDNREFKSRELPVDSKDLSEPGTSGQFQINGQFQNEQSLADASTNQSEISTAHRPGFEHSTQKTTEFKVAEPSPSSINSHRQAELDSSIAEMKPATNDRLNSKSPPSGQFAPHSIANTAVTHTDNAKAAVANKDFARPRLQKTTAAKGRVSVAKREVYDPAAERLRHSSLFGPRQKRRFRFGF